MDGTIAVTGASGFIGRRVVRRLRADGWRVRILVRRPPDPELTGPGLEPVEGSLGDVASLRRLVSGAGAVVHIAGLVRARSRAELLAANADGVARLLDAVTANAGRARLCVISSLAARHPELSDYAASKRAGETAVTSAGAGLRWTILRPPAVYGPGDRQTLPFFRWVSRGLAPVLGPDGARVSLLHVDDLAAAVVAVIREDGAVGLIGELDDGQPGGHSWPGMIAAAAELLGTRPRLLRVPRGVLHAIGALNGALRAVPGHAPMLTTGKVRELSHPDWVCNPQAMVAATGWRAERPLAVGFGETIAWYRRRGWL